MKQIKFGEYAGPDFGMVTKISDQEVELHELVAGLWGEGLSDLARYIFKARVGTKMKYITNDIIVAWLCFAGVAITHAEENLANSIEAVSCCKDR